MRYNKQSVTTAGWLECHAYAFPLIVDRRHFAVTGGTMGLCGSKPKDESKITGLDKSRSRNLRDASVASNLSLGSEEGDPRLRYDVLDTIGTGGFAVVKRVREKSSGKSYAMKIISVDMDDTGSEVGAL